MRCKVSLGFLGVVGGDIVSRASYSQKNQQLEVFVQPPLAMEQPQFSDYELTKFF